jgi:hypothetical protein
MNAFELATPDWSFPRPKLRITHNFFRVVPTGVGGNPVSLRSCLYLNDAGFPPETAGKTGTPSRGRLAGCFDICG